MRKDVFCFDCKCGWQHTDAVNGLSDAAMKYESGCPECGKEPTTYVEFDNKLWRLDAKVGKWKYVDNPRITQLLREWGK